MQQGAAYLGDCSLWLFHTHLIQQSGSSVVKQAASVPAEVTPLVIITSMGHLNVPEVFRNVCLDLPSKTQSLSALASHHEKGVARS